MTAIELNSYLSLIGRQDLHVKSDPSLERGRRHINEDETRKTGAPQSLRTDVRP